VRFSHKLCPCRSLFLCQEARYLKKRVFDTVASCHIPLRSEAYLCILKPVSKLTYQIFVFSLSFATGADLPGAEERGEKRVIRRIKLCLLRFGKLSLCNMRGEKGIITMIDINQSSDQQEVQPALATTKLGLPKIPVPRQLTQW
jgi:hypothetical protein